MKLLKEWIYRDSICAITENDLLHTLCGYASVTEEHKLFGKDYQEVPEEFDIIHGGLTYAGMDLNYPVTSKGGLWWFGFDFAHAGDFDLITHKMNYKIEDVILEAEKLATLLFLYEGD